MDRGRNEDSLTHLSYGAAFAQPCGSAPSVLKPEAMVFGACFLGGALRVELRLTFIFANPCIASAGRTP